MDKNFFRFGTLGLMLLLMTIPVSASILNISIISAESPFQRLVIDSGEVNSYDLNLQTGNYIAGGFAGFGGGGAGGRSGDSVTSTGMINDYKSRVIAEQIINYQKEGEPLYFSFYRVDGSAVSGYVRLLPTGLLTGTRTIHLNENGGSTKTTGYSRDPTGTIIYADTLYAFVAVDACTEQQYFIVSEGSPMDNGLALWDNSTNANILISDVTSNPFYHSYYTTFGSKTFRINTAAVKVDDYKNSLNMAVCRSAPNNLFDMWGWLNFLIAPLKPVINALVKLSQSLGLLSALMWGVSAIIFGVQFFVGANAFYTLINAVWCMRPAIKTDASWLVVFRFREFILNEMALIDFYIRFVNWLKDLIKWW